MLQDRLHEFVQLIANPIQAHIHIFPHRHTDRTPVFHDELVRDIHDLTIQQLLAMTFRGGAKSTLLEEAMLLLALQGVFPNGIVVGESEARAADRLTAIKYEIENNERIHYFFGEQKGPIWGETRCLLANGTYLQAYGRGQSLRGIKFRDARPSFAFLDDIENEESTSSSAATDKTMRWIFGVLLPAMDKHRHYIRMAGTPIAPDTACGRLANNSSFKTIKIPVWYYPPALANSKLRSSWPERFPLEDMLRQKDEYERMGMAREFAQEYLCQADTEQTKAFDNTSLPIDPLLRHTFQPTIVIVDPARTAKASSSLTGTAVFSWVNSQLIVWEADGYLWRPSDIINHIFDLNQKYNPIFIGVEKDGLEEFIMQPLRTEMLRRSTYLPIVPIKAPKGKLDFIRGLQPYLTVKEIQLAQPCPALQSQLQNFPSGKIDTLNALAYALRMHPGEPIYTQFSASVHLRPSAPSSLASYVPIIFALNSTPTETAGAAITIIKRTIVVLADIVAQGAPQQASMEVMDYLRFTTNKSPTNIVLPKKHWDNYEAIGLRSSLAQNHHRPSLGGDPHKGRAELQQRMEVLPNPQPQFQVSDAATWTLRALTGGFAYDSTPGATSRLPKPNSYATLMEAIECAVYVLAHTLEDESGRNYRHTSTGRRYLSAKA